MVIQLALKIDHYKQSGIAVNRENCNPDSKNNHNSEDNNESEKNFFDFSISKLEKKIQASALESDLNTIF